MAGDAIWWSRLRPPAASTRRAPPPETRPPRRGGWPHQAGTLSGTPLAVAAGLATLRKLDGAAYVGIEPAATRLATGLRRSSADLPVQVASVPGLLTVFFNADPVQDFAGAQACDTKAYARFCRAMLDRGVYPPASQFEAWFPSLAHAEEPIDRTIEAAAEALGLAIP